MSYLKSSVAVLMLLAIHGAGCPVKAQRNSQPHPHVQAPTEMRVLYLGNSLTAANDLPAMVQAMAQSGGIKLTYKAITQGGFNLEDHWNDGQSLLTLRREKWDYVVLQQGPSSLPDSQADLKKWAKVWADEARKFGAKPALYMVWPFQNQQDGFALVSQAYSEAAKASKSQLLPAGRAWETCTRNTPDITLYLPDRLHPTLAGSYLAALAISHSLFGRQIETVPTKLKILGGREFGVSEQLAQRLRRAALKAYAN